MALFELLFLQLSLTRSRYRQGRRTGLAFPRPSRLTDDFFGSLPFALTDSQIEAFAEIEADLARPCPMNRLLQGDVGCGKTVVALGAAMTVVNAGYQAALMAPTEILAKQHWHTLNLHARRLGQTVDLLTGGLSEQDKVAVRGRLASGETRFVVGTHALISQMVHFRNLGLVIIDEQHRFGVAQRLALREKAATADLLVMTATPIPRSLAMTLYGDLDLSLIRHRPPGRKKVSTRVFDSTGRLEAYRILAEKVGQGGQAYVVAPPHL